VIAHEFFLRFSASRSCRIRRVSSPAIDFPIGMRQSVLALTAGEGPATRASRPTFLTAPNYYGKGRDGKTIDKCRPPLVTVVRGGRMDQWLA
jgi:hypothetical protein